MMSIYGANDPTTLTILFKSDDFLACMVGCGSDLLSICLLYNKIALLLSFHAHIVLTVMCEFLYSYIMTCAFVYIMPGLAIP